MTHQHATLEDTVYFWFASNDTAGSGNNGATPAAHVRLAGAGAAVAPVLSPTPTLLTNAAYPAGCHEVAVAATAANGFAADSTYAVFCTLAVDSQNPTGFIGSVMLSPIISDTRRVLNDANAVKIGTSGLQETEAGQIADGAIVAATFAAGAINAPAIATDAITNAKIAAGAITSSEAPNLDVAVGTRATVNGVWSEAKASYTTSGTFGFNLDVPVSSVSGGGGLTKQDVADALSLAPVDVPQSGSVNHVLPLGNAPSSGRLITGGTGTDQINTTQGATDSNVVAWQDESLVSGTKMIENAPTVPRWTQAALAETWSVSLTEPTGRPSWGAMTYGALMSWLGVLSLNKRATTSSDARVRNNADNANIATAAQSDDSTTYLIGPWV